MSDAIRSKTPSQSDEQPRPPTRRAPEQPHSEDHSQQKRALVPAWAWAAAAALLFFAAYTTWQAQHLSGEFVDLQHRATEEQQRGIALQSEQQRYQQALNIVAAAATKQLQLKPVASSPKENIPIVTAYWNQQLGLALSADKMPQVASGRTLQLWIVAQTGTLISAGIFRPNANGQILLVMPPNAAMNSARSLAISDEPAGGSPQPTSTFEWSASIN